MKKISYLALTNLAQYVLLNMVIPQVEEGRHNAEVVGLFLIHDNVLMGVKGSPTASRLKVLSERGTYIQACDQCVIMRDLMNSLEDFVKVGCFPDFYAKVLDRSDFIVTL